jgi:hypothetical protein
MAFTRVALIGISLPLLWTIPLPAQEPEVENDVLVLSHSFQAGSREFVRVFLMQGEVYRAEINLDRVSFSIRPRHPGSEPPTVMPLRGNDGTGEEAVYEIYPFKDDEYELQVLDVPAGQTGSLRIFRDVRASRRRQLAARGAGGNSGWKLGIELAAGYHGSYQLSRYEEFVNVERSGADYEGCLSLRAQATRVWGCLIGFTQHGGGEAASIVWFFVEPRMRLIGGVIGDPLELGVMMRLGFGAADQDLVGAAYDHPGQVTPGLYFRYWVGSPGKGLSVSTVARRAFILGSELDDVSFTQFGAVVSFHF